MSLKESIKWTINSVKNVIRRITNLVKNAIRQIMNLVNKVIQRKEFKVKCLFDVLWFAGKNAVNLTRLAKRVLSKCPMMTIPIQNIINTELINDEIAALFITWTQIRIITHEKGSKEQMSFDWRSIRIRIGWLWEPALKGCLKVLGRRLSCS